jgi:predicted O-methyltransferase YrrM
MDTFVQSVIELQTKLPFVEGFTHPQQAQQLESFLKEHPEIKTIGEVGFNVGMSSAVFLHAIPDAKVYSFDIGHWSYVGHQKALIDRLWPGRHMLTIGDSRQSVPQFTELVKEPIFDFVFIDGGHQDNIPISDIMNFLKLVKPGGILCIDDVCGEPFAKPVVAAYMKAVEEKLVEHIMHYDCAPRGWAYCRKL